MLCVAPPPGLAFNFIASFSKDGGQVPVVYTFAKRQGDAKTAVAKMLEGKKAGKLPINGVFISTNNLTFFSGVCTAVEDAHAGARMRMFMCLRLRVCMWLSEVVVDADRATSITIDYNYTHRHASMQTLTHEHAWTPATTPKQLCAQLCHRAREDDFCNMLRPHHPQSSCWQQPLPNWTSPSLAGMPSPAPPWPTC